MVSSLRDRDVVFSRILSRAFSVSSKFPVVDGTGVDSGSSVTFAFLLVVRICLYTTSSGRSVRGVSNGETWVFVRSCKSVNFFSMLCTAAI